MEPSSLATLKAHYELSVPMPERGRDKPFTKVSSAFLWRMAQFISWHFLDLREKHSQSPRAHLPPGTEMTASKVTSKLLQPQSDHPNPPDLCGATGLPALSPGTPNPINDIHMFG